MGHYGIKTADPTKWQKLATQLALHFVPAMQFEEKRGAAKKWEWQQLYALYALVQKLQAANPAMKAKQVFTLVPKAAQAVPLLKNVKLKTPAKTLENAYYSFLNTPAFTVLMAIERSGKAPLKVRAGVLGTI